MKDAVAVVLFAGLGTRMRSRRQKGLHVAAGRPLVWYPVDAALRAGFAKVVLVIGHQAEVVADAVRGLFPGAPVEFAVQAEQKGTAHATMCARPHCEGFRNAVVVNGDMAVLRPESLRALCDAFTASGGLFALTSAMLPDPTGYGRILRDADGMPAEIVEERDATPAQRAIREGNVGVYASAADVLFGMLSGVGSANAKKEFYFTDVVKALRDAGKPVGLHVVEDADEALQVNDRAGLAEVEAALHRRKARELMAAGVTIRQPATVMIDVDCAVGPDSEVWPGVEMHAGTVVGAGCSIGRGCVLTNVRIGDGVAVKPYCVMTDAVVEDEAQMGPFSHLRPASVVRRGAHVGNFVEMKKTVLGPGAKANHLTYLGDCTVGAKANIGAGTITCNYDGVHKLPTEIGDGAFIGSDTQLVAPVKVGKDAYVAAGATIVKDVPDGALAITRVEQKNVEGYTARRRARTAK
ncbi:MAG: bifunctional UDP-N-acetylglucosamine diphosphorylase/glucosamine-1-phosphate N-acetyltransferase GlmU [Deltaproteobacteria bacterium]|nr:bifunctional UDP-N-acetylglucosamine diphosphorylase/glucosamine-1-phosphate N-acetyltransferase GlmU [Deltaproteobacteria bacterium]